jgi:ATP/maltotriose-dependent transcriptional regulator MalT
MRARDDNRRRGSALISTKLSHRYDGRATVPRGRLLAQLAPLLDRQARVATVEAPAGYGKSTLLSQWREHLTEQGIASGWLSLEPADTDPARFLSYLTAALVPLLPEFEPNVPPGLIAGNSFAVEFLIAEVIQALARDPRPFVLFLDDYHCIKSREVHEIVSALVRATPPLMTYVVAGRHRAPLAFVELKLNDALIEITPEDLSFRDDETRIFLREIRGITVDDPGLAALSSRAEGWIAGLQFAALALEHSADTAQFIAEFSGNDLDITNYLGEVVLDRLPEGEREFLLLSSVLGRMNASLCERVTGRADSQRMLEGVARAHLFLRPLDREQKWYRYHQLFSDFLIARLDAQRPGLKATLLDAASEWAFTNGYQFEAVEYAFQARNLERAAELISALAPDLARRRGEMHTVLDWVKKLPVHLLDRHPWIRLANTWCLTFCRRWEEAEAQMCALEQLVNSLNKTPSAETRAIGASLEMNRAIMFTAHDQFHLSRESCARWLKNWPDGDAVDIAAVATALVYSTLNTYEFAFGREKYLVARRACEACENYYAMAWNFSCLGMIALREGHLKEALQIYREGLEFVAQHGAVHSFMISLLSIFLAEALYEADCTTEAQFYLTQAKPFLNNHGTVEVAIAGYGTQAKLLAMAGLHAEALEVLREAEKLGYEAGLSRLSAAMLGEQIAISMRHGGGSSANVAGFSASDNQRLDADKREVVEEIRRLAQVRRLLHEKKPERALLILAAEIVNAKKSGRVRRFIELQILKASALWTTGRCKEAQRQIEVAFALAAPEGFVRVFVDEGPVIHEIIRARTDGQSASAKTAADEGIEQFLLTLERAFIKTGEVTAQAVRSSTPLTDVPALSNLPDVTGVLTRREQQLLNLLEAGYSNSDLARSLFISEQTVKWHLHNLYHKLGAKSRTTALARARRLALL